MDHTTDTIVYVLNMLSEVCFDGLPNSQRIRMRTLVSNLETSYRMREGHEYADRMFAKSVQV